MKGDKTLYNVQITLPPQNLDFTQMLIYLLIWYAFIFSYFEMHTTYFCMSLSLCLLHYVKNI